MGESQVKPLLEKAFAALRANLDSFAQATGFSVDIEKGTITGAALMKIGDARGHGFSIDATTLQQVADLINAQPGGIGVKSRFKHPAHTEEEGVADDLGDVVGRVNNARIDGDTLRGDVVLGDYAANLPGLGDVKSYLLSRAKSDPTGLGLSAVIGFVPLPITDSAGNVTATVARVSDVAAIDFVGRGAATPNGLLSERRPAPPISTQPTEKSEKSKNTRGGKSVDAKLKQYLIANEGLAANASDEDAEELFNGLPAEDKTKASEATKLAAKPVKNDDAAQIAQLASVQHEAMLAAEGKRVTMLRQLADTLGVDESIAKESIAAGEDLVKARVRFLTHLQEKSAAQTAKLGRKVNGEVRVGDDANQSTMVAALSDAIRLRAGAKIEKPHDRALQLKSVTLIEMGRHYLSAHGVGEAFTLTRDQVWRMLTRPTQFAAQYAALGQSTGSFLNITLDAANKSLRQAYLDGQATWTKWARKATAPDFKNINRIALSDSPGLASRAEGGEIKFAVMTDSKEVYAVSEYTSGIRLTRQAIINDDLDAFSRIPQLQGSAARRKEDDVTYTILTANAALADAVALFDATTHKNYTSSGTVLSVASLAVARKSLRIQTGPKGAYLNLVPKFLIVPAALESIAEQYTSNQFVAAVSASVNPFAGGGPSALTPVVEPRLDADSATKWYTAADSSQIDTVEVCFLQDEPEPVLKQEVDFDTDDVKFAVRHTVAAKAIDYRGLYLNAGA